MTIKIVDEIGNVISRNSIFGMVITFISALAAKAQEVAMLEDTRHTITSLAADLGIIIGFLIGLLTLAIKCKDFYKAYFADKKEEQENDTDKQESSK